LLYGQKHTILVCDNSSGSRKALASVFSKMELVQAQVIQLSSGREIMDSLRDMAKAKKYPSVIVMDFLLTDSNALQVCREIRKNHPPIPVAVVGVSDGSTEEVTSLYRCGANAYFCKPTLDEEYIPIANTIAHVWLYGPKPDWSTGRTSGDRRKRRFYHRRESDEL